jgi:phosphate:Na+ symporter
MRLIAAHLRDIASGSIRDLVARTVSHPLLAPFAGFLAGAVTQSTSAATFIATGLVSARALSIAVAMSMLAWANAGTSALVLLASFDSHTLALYLLALIGLAFFNGLDIDQRFRHVVYALFGLGLLLLGLSLVRSAVNEVRADFWIREFVEFTASGSGVSLLAGFVLAIAFQSSSIVTALALPLVSEGLLNLHGMSLLILGACAGSGTAVVLVASGMEGPARQLALTQGLVRSLSSALLLPLVLAEGIGLPVGPATAALAITAHPALQVGLVFLAVQIAGIAVARVFRSPILSLATRFAPESPAEVLSRPAYLYDEAAADPSTAFTLLRLEHVRLIQAFPDYLEDLRVETERTPDSPPLEVRASASNAILGQMDEFLLDITRTNPEVSAEQVFDIRRRHSDLKDLHATLERFVVRLKGIPLSERPDFVAALVEGLHALLVVVAEATDEGGEEARILVAELTGEHGALIDRVRRELLSGAASLAGREQILDAVLALERLLWILRERSPLPANTLIDLLQSRAGDSLAGVLT